MRLSKLFLGWLTPRVYGPGDAALDVVSSVLAGGKNSRLYKPLVYDTQMAQDVEATQQSGLLGSSFIIEVTVRPGHTVAEVQKRHREELETLKREPPTERELGGPSTRSRRRSTAGWSAWAGSAARPISSIRTTPRVVGPTTLPRTSLATRAVAREVQAAAAQWLPSDRRVELTVNPEEAKR